jgi:hypothetical protein
MRDKETLRRQHSYYQVSLKSIKTTVTTHHDYTDRAVLVAQTSRLNDELRAGRVAARVWHHGEFVKARRQGLRVKFVSAAHIAVPVLENRWKNLKRVGGWVEEG